MMATSTNGVAWTSPVPIARPTPTADLFMPSIGVDQTDLTQPNLALTFHSEADRNCTLNGDPTTSPCVISVLYQSSKDAGNTWGTARPLAGPMEVRTMAMAGGLGMLGDYTSTSVVRGNAISVFASSAGPGTATPNLDQAMYVAGPLPLTDSAAAGNASTGTGPVPTLANITKCMNPSPSGGQVQLQTCNGTSEQEWTYTAQTLRVLGKCLAVVNGGVANGTRVQILDCYGGSAQQWIKLADDSLLNPQSNKCLDTPGTANGTALQIWDCNHAPRQRWYHATYAAGDTLWKGQQLNQRTFLRSSDGRFMLILQADNNLVIYGPGMQALWATNVFSQTVRLTLQSDGNVVAYSGNNTPTWSTSTSGSAGHHLVIQSDGNLVLYSAGGQAVWNSGTCCH
jgi:Ricin-type beta-trefoil lectin domain